MKDFYYRSILFDNGTSGHCAVETIRLTILPSKWIYFQGETGSHHHTPLMEEIYAQSSLQSAELFWQNIVFPRRAVFFYWVLILLHNTRIFGILDQIGDHLDNNIYKSLIVMLSVDEDENLDKKKTGRKYKRWHRNLVLFQYWQILVSSDILALNWDWNTTSLYSIHLHI